MAVSLPPNKKKIDYGCLDRLSNLPKEVINEILEHMPINEAVKTSMISRNWRYRWMSISKLIFNSHSISFSNERGRTKADLVNYVTNILLLHNGMISKFEVNNFLESGCSDVDRWILVLSRMMLKDLVLAFHKPNSYLVPASLFACENLTKLMLKGCKLRLPSQYEGFSHLTCIDLQVVDTTVATIEKLVEMSPLLLSLKVWSCNYLDQCLTVHAPNLIHCTINGLCEGIRFRNAPKLESAYIKIGKVEEHFFHRATATCKLDEVLHGVDRIRTINIYFPFMDVNIFDKKAKTAPRKLQMTYCDLKVVNLVINFNETKQIYAVLCLCRSAPNLEELIIKDCKKVATDLLLITDPFWESQVCKEGDIFHHLKIVSLSDFEGGYNQLGIAEFILLNSVVLETLSIEWKKRIKVDKKLLRVLEQMMQFKRSSTEVKVVFSGLS